MAKRATGGGTKATTRARASRAAGDKRVEPSEAPSGSKSPAPGLYLVATPIGNLGDITLRAIDLLGRVDLVACEDTRVTERLFRRHGIRTRLAPYHEHNAERARPELIRRLAGGASVALVSDAGTPLVSDPGHKLVRSAIEAGISVTALPGPSAALAALQLSGLPSDRFLFAGFLPSRDAARLRALAELAAVPATLIFFETAPRLVETLAAMAERLGDRPAAVARELTKLFEEVRRDGVAALARHYAEAGPPKGELVILVGPPPDPARAAPTEIDAALEIALARMSLKDAVAAVAAATGEPRREVYARALALRRPGPA
jgi:16S rRNA (cytidine1402-2'-O)-methyltransferase